MCASNPRLSDLFAGPLRAVFRTVLALCIERFSLNCRRVPDRPDVAIRRVVFGDHSAYPAY